ncbi:MAG: hypothetical protein WAV67_02325 [Dokdonella sp.]
MLRRLDRVPAVICHLFGGMLAQMLASQDISAVKVAIRPTGFRDVIPLPFSALK